MLSICQFDDNFNAFCAVAVVVAMVGSSESVFAIRGKVTTVAVVGLVVGVVAVVDVVAIVAVLALIGAVVVQLWILFRLVLFLLLFKKLA